MKKYIFLFIMHGLLQAGHAQSSAPLNLPKDAKIEGTIVQMKTNEPLNNELVVFKSQKNLKRVLLLCRESLNMREFRQLLGAYELSEFVGF